MTRRSALPILLSACLFVPTIAGAKEHPGTEFLTKNGYKGPESCEAAGCHPGTAKAFLSTVHWTHASTAPHVSGADPKVAWGMKNRAYTMCNGNDIVNNLKEIVAKDGSGKTKFSGCNTCHPGNHLSDVGSTGPDAERAVDCLVCHSAKYDYSKRKPFKDEKGNVVLGQDRSKEAALAVGKPNVKNCMACHEAAGGGVLVKRGFQFDKTHDAHAAQGMVCVDCHKTGKDHRIPTGFDPNNWASDGLRLSCSAVDCHGEAPHKNADYNTHVGKIACQTCHVPNTGGAFAKDFTKWTKLANGFWEPTTIRKEANENIPVHAWHDNSAVESPSFIGPGATRQSKGAKIFPFKLFQGKGYFDGKSGKLLSMDFAAPMATGDTLAGVAAAAKTLGIASYDPVPGWQTIYFGSNHLVAPKDRAHRCANCHAPNGILHFRDLGYSEAETGKLTSPELYFTKEAARLENEW